MSDQWKLVPVEPTETMVINGFESEPDECFSDEEVWEQYQGMSGCQQAAFRAKLCWAAMLAAAPAPPQGDTQTVGEREEFTNWVRREWPQAPLNYVRDLLPEDDSRYGEYCDERIQRAWVSWQARAALSRPDAAEVARLIAERNALQQRLNAADQRIDELTAQQPESRVITLSGCEFTEHDLLHTAVRMVTGTSRRGTQRWVAMKDAFCCGSGVAHALCRRFGFDPDETVKP